MDREHAEHVLRGGRRGRRAIPRGRKEEPAVERHEGSASCTLGVSGVHAHARPLAPHEKGVYQGFVTFVGMSDRDRSPLPY